MSANALVDQHNSSIRYHLSGDPSQLFHLLDILPVAAYVCDSEGLIAYFNSLAEQLWGRAPQLNNISDRYCGSFKLFRRDGTPLKNDQCFAAGTLRTGHDSSGNEIVIARPDGSRLTVQVYTHAIHDESGKIKGVVVLLVEVTANKPADADLAATHQQLVRENAELRDNLRRKDAFLTTLAHELRNPLAPISNSLQILTLSSDFNSSFGEVKAIMQRQLQQLVRLVDDLQIVARMVHGTVEMRPARISLESILKNAMQSVQPLIVAADHRLTLSLTGELAIVNADAARLTQALSNVLINAVKYSAPSSEIWLTGKHEGDLAIISVRDMGSGIPADALDHIFDMYAPTRQTQTRSQNGLGVGLAVAKRIVELHGGQIEARSAGLGQGSEFFIRLPLAPKFAESLGRATPSLETAPQVMERTAPQGSSIKSPVSASETVDRVGGHRILVVDDQRSASYVLSKLLQAMGQTVQTADSAETAIAIACRELPDIIISDITMPDVDGYELARRLRREPCLQSTILVALTGLGEDHDRQQSKAAGFDHHLVKPVSVEALQELLKHANLATGSIRPR